MGFWPLTLTKRLVKGSPVTPAEEDQNFTDIEGAVNANHTALSVALNNDGTLKAGAINNSNIFAPRIVNQNALSFLTDFYEVDTGGGGANAIQIVTTGGGGAALAAYAAGLRFPIKIANSNTGATTLKVDGLAAVAVKKITTGGLSDLTANDIIVGGVYEFIHDGTQFMLIGASPIIHGLVTCNVQTDTQFLNTRMGSFIQFAHGAGATRPISVQWTLVCFVDDHSYKAADIANGADEIDVMGILDYIAGADVDFDLPFVPYVNDTYAGISVVAAADVTGLNVQDKGGASDFDLTTTSWKLRARILTLS